MGALIGPAWSDPSGALEREQLAVEGVRTLAANNKVSGGIEAVRRRLIARADGTPGLLIDARCINLLREIEAYEWEDGSAGKSIPIKVNDHALDALRYLCVALDRRVSWQQRDGLLA